MCAYRLDRTAFKAQTANEACTSHAVYYKKITWQERLQIAQYLNSIAFNFPDGEPPKLDRTKFSVRARGNGNIFHDDFRDL
jgi:hypothetical protein